MPIPTSRTTLHLHRERSPAADAALPPDATVANTSSRWRNVEPKTRLIEIRYRNNNVVDASASSTAVDMRKKCFSSTTTQWLE